MYTYIYTYIHIYVGKEYPVQGDKYVCMCIYIHIHIHIHTSHIYAFVHTYAYIYINTQALRTYRACRQPGHLNYIDI